MKARLLVLFAAATLTGTSLGAQDLTRCPATTNAQRISSGRLSEGDRSLPVHGPAARHEHHRRQRHTRPGQAAWAASGTFRSGFRVNAVQGSLPAGSERHAVGDRRDVQKLSIPRLSSFRCRPPISRSASSRAFRSPSPMLAGVDLLVSAAYLPEFNGSGVSVKVPNGSLKLGYGARVGILQESLLVPGVSVSYLRRDLPTVNIAANSGNDSLYVNNLSLKTNAWRVVASKSLLLFGLAAGFGQDKYESSTDIGAHLPHERSRQRRQPTLARSRCRRTSPAPTSLRICR